MADQEKGRDRRADIEGRPLDPLSLVGSWFHRLDEGGFVWQGLVVGEMQPGVYLFEIHDWFTGDSKHQVPVTVEQMTRNDDTEYRFYDTREAMKNAWYRARAAVRVDVEEQSPSD